MKVRTYKTIDIDVEVDVDLDAFLSELGTRCEEAAPDFTRQMLSGMDCLTRIAARVSDEVVAKFPADARRILAERFQAEATRYGGEEHDA
jgi:hypothetical protein